MDGRTPVIVGVGQLVDRESTPETALEPLAMLERAARSAADDAGAGPRLLEAIDACALVDVFGWRPKNGAALLAEALGARPAHTLVSSIGGEIGLTLLERAAGLLADGAARVALVAGSNHVKTLAAPGGREVARGWQSGGAGEPTPVGEFRWGTSDLEQRYGLRMPVEVYPLFENALRAHRGVDPDTHQWNMGRLMSRFTEVAAKNPYAWFPVFRSPEELIRVGAQNRMIAWPYPKYLNAVLATDQAAAVLVTTAQVASELGVPREHWIVYRGGAHLEERAWYTSERRNFHASPALRAAAHTALARAGLELDQIAAFDFYSCFPVAVEMACEMLGLAEDDPRGFTVTGGLPYAGGPGSSYTLHAVAAMVERLRARPGAGLVTGNGWYLTKHSAAVLASEPGDPAAARPDPPVELPEPLVVSEDAAGPAAIEAYTVVFDREGAPNRGIVIGRSDDGRRFLANTPADRATLSALCEGEAVGRRGHITRPDGLHVFEPV